MEKETKVLVVDDEPGIRDVVRFALEKAGFQVLEARNGRAALEAVRVASPDLIVLDILMPDLDGTEVCRRIRSRQETPIIFLSSQDEELDRVLGLELGGDDYLTKPFSPRELVARVRAVLRRARPRTLKVERPSTLREGALEVDLDAFKVRWAGREVSLTVTEFGLLRVLISRPGKVYSRDELMSRAYEDHVVVSGRTIDSHVRRLRQKLSKVGASPIETVHGVGYRLSISS